MRLAAKSGVTMPVGALLAVLAPAAMPVAEIEAFVDGFAAAAPKDDGQGGGLSEARFLHRGRPVAYKTAGIGREGVPVALVDGFGGDFDNWLFNIETLAEARPVYAIDLPGHGKSAKEVESGAIDELARAQGRARPSRRPFARRGSRIRGVRATPGSRRLARGRRACGPSRYDRRRLHPRLHRGRETQGREGDPAETVRRSRARLGADGRGRAEVQAARRRARRSRPSQPRRCPKDGRRSTTAVWSKRRARPC